MTAPAIPQAAPGSEPIEDFEAYLLQQVQAEMDRLTDAQAVDEWHASILDPFIDSRVDVQHSRLEQQRVRRVADLSMTLESARFDLRLADDHFASALQERESARERLSAAEETLLEVQSAVTGLAAAPKSEGPIRRVLKGLATWRARRRPSLETLHRRVSEQRALVAKAAADHAQALAEFRGPASRKDDTPS